MENEERVVATCEECGAVYAAVDLPNNGLQPIGSRSGCASCGGTEFAPLRSMMENADSPDATIDD